MLYDRLERYRVMAVTIQNCEFALWLALRSDDDNAGWDRLIADL